MNYAKYNKEVDQMLKAIGDPDEEGLRLDVLKCAIRYAHIRAEWKFPVSKVSDATRTRAHDAFIESCKILCRYQLKKARPQKWHDLLDLNRKLVGDFACEIHAAVAISNR